METKEHEYKKFGCVRFAVARAEFKGMGLNKENIKYRKDHTLYISFAICIGAATGLLTATKLDIVLTVVGFVGLALITHRWPSWPFLIIPWAIAIWLPLINLGGPAPYTITVLDALLALLGIEIVLALLGFWPHISGRNQHFAVQIFILAWLPLIPAMIGSLASFGPNPDILVRGFLIFTRRWAEYSVLPLAACLFLSKQSIRWVNCSLIGAITILSVSAFIPEFKQALLSYVGISAEIFGEFGIRATGLLFNPNVFGVFLLLMLNLFVGLLLIRRLSLWKTATLTLFLIIVFAALLATGARGIMILGLPISLLFWLFLDHGTTVRKALVGLTAVLAIAVLLQSPLGQILKGRFERLRISGFQEANLYARLYNQKQGLEIAAMYPYGLGVGNIGRIGTYKLVGRIGTTDNQWIDLLIESNFLGLLLFIIPLILIYRRSAHRKTLMSLVVRACMVSSVGVSFAYSVFNMPAISASLWLLIALSEVEAAGFVKQNGGKKQ